MNSKVDQRPAGDGSDSGVLVVGHGTRDAAGIAEFHEVARQLAIRLAPRPVEAGFLELAEPPIAAAVDRLAARGVRRFTVAPVVLFAAGHANRDIPEAVAAAAARHAGLTWTHAEPLGLHPLIVELSALRYDEAITDRPTIAAEETLLIVVGRGSSDPEATAATEAFVRLRAAVRPVGRAVTAFAALAEPRVDEVLCEAAKAGFQRIVVQPHLLFHGELLDGLRRQTAEAAAAAPDRRWLVTQHLGADERLTTALVARIDEADRNSPFPRAENRQKA